MRPVVVRERWMMCTYGADVDKIVGAILDGAGMPSNGYTPLVFIRGLWDYAVLVKATKTPINRAITYLKDTGSPEHARGRLLLRAAERSLRESGDVGGEET
jgi:hypothetical protein